MAVAGVAALKDQVEVNQSSFDAFLLRMDQQFEWLRNKLDPNGEIPYPLDLKQEVLNPTIILDLEQKENEIKTEPEQQGIVTETDQFMTAIEAELEDKVGVFEVDLVQKLTTIETIKEPIEMGILGSPTPTAKVHEGSASSDLKGHYISTQINYKNPNLNFPKLNGENVNAWPSGVNDYINGGTDMIGLYLTPIYRAYHINHTPRLEDWFNQHCFENLWGIVVSIVCSVLEIHFSRMRTTNQWLLIEDSIIFMPYGGQFDVHDAVKKYLDRLLTEVFYGALLKLFSMSITGVSQTMVVAVNMAILEHVCDFFFCHEADANGLKAALAEAGKLINWLEGMVVLGYFVLLVFDPGGTRMKRPFCLKFKEEQFKVNIDQIDLIANAVTGAYANFVIEEKLEASMDSILKGIPLENSNLDHWDSCLIYVKQFVIIMFKVNEPNVTAASVGDRKRNMLLGRGIFVTYSNSVTNVAANEQDGIAYFHAGPDDIVQSVTRSGILCFIAINDLNQYIAKRRSSAMQLVSSVWKASYEDNAPSKCRRAY